MAGLVEALINTRKPDKEYKELIVGEKKFEAADSKFLIEPEDLGKKRKIKLLLYPSDKEAQTRVNSRNKFYQDNSSRLTVSGEIVDVDESEGELKLITDQGLVYVKIDETIQKQELQEGKVLWTPVKRAEIKGIKDR